MTYKIVSVDFPMVSGVTAVADVTVEWPEAGLKTYRINYTFGDKIQQVDCPQYSEECVEVSLHAEFLAEAREAVLYHRDVLRDMN